MRTSLNSLSPVLRDYKRSPVSRLRYVLEGSAWAIAYGVVIGALWFGADLAGPYLRSLG
ncbi:hypothetical protein [Burkholderia multivorans]|uniref:hypothetical protein n=1 Tax=Burkholderia multivorans TaxID=87883 RepID=UPI0009E0C9EB|nr:hypothetical protein [Burkholderia multivorans]MCO1402867.1 hypothetical protein [Burkholderia multivorans]MDR9051738.1 hypothetical protein [Burkholderia multivorans]MDR9057724.1 hypothetical protein [Burkholderia multivorans]MDR9064635.1 hypothetical protein [Burkholderia multivorans]MDR9069754.1 hypothetical protein [Burkholderia multivorans]